MEKFTNPELLEFLCEDPISGSPDNIIPGDGNGTDTTIPE